MREIDENVFGKNCVVVCPLDYRIKPEVWVKNNKSQPQKITFSKLNIEK